MISRALFLSIAFYFFSDWLPADEGHGHTHRKADRLKVLSFSGTGWYRHPETAAINRWLVLLGDKRGFDVDVSEDGKDLRSKQIARYQVVILNNANELVSVLSEEERKSVEDWYAGGKGIVALHAALVHQQDWKWLSDLGGCDFDSDSEYLKAKVVVDPAAKEHPVVQGHGDSFWYTADWTNHTRTVTGLPGFQVLLRVDESTYDPVREFFKKRNGKAMGKDHPVSWINENGGGRFFYTELGHDVRSLDTSFGRRHVTEAVRWAAGIKEMKQP